MTKINDSADVSSLNQLPSWYGDSTDATSSTVSTITPLDYVTSMHIDHTTSTVHPFHYYPMVPAPQTFNYGTRETPSPSQDS